MSRFLHPFKININEESVQLSFSCLNFYVFLKIHFQPRLFLNERCLEFVQPPQSFSCVLSTFHCSIFCPETKVYSKWGNVSSALWVKAERPSISQQQFSEILVHAVYWEGPGTALFWNPPPRILGQYPTLLANLNPSWPKQCQNYP